MRSFAKQDLIQHNGYTKISQLLAAGEFPAVAFMQVTKLEKIRERDGPVDWIPLERDRRELTCGRVHASDQAGKDSRARIFSSLVTCMNATAGEFPAVAFERNPIHRPIALANLFQLGHLHERDRRELTCGQEL